MLIAIIVLFVVPVIGYLLAIVIAWGILTDGGTNSDGDISFKYAFILLTSILILALVLGIYRFIKL